MVSIPNALMFGRSVRFWLRHLAAQAEFHSARKGPSWVGRAPARSRG